MIASVHYWTSTIVEVVLVATIVFLIWHIVQIGRK